MSEGDMYYGQKSISVFYGGVVVEFVCVGDMEFIR